MRINGYVRTAAKWAAAAFGVATAAYGAYVVTTWYRYGHPARPDADDSDPLLERFMPQYEIVERHSIRVDAPAAVTLSAAREIDLLASPLVHAIVRTREIVLGAIADQRDRPRGLLAETLSLGWGVLADVPGREIVVGAYTRPWEANVTFHALPPDQFAAFDEPGYVKIVWTLRADPIGDGTSLFKTETRAVSTDPSARRRFRRYWSFVSPGIIMIRWALLEPLKHEAERRANAARTIERDRTDVAAVAERR